MLALVGCTGTMSICETPPAPFQHGVNHKTWAAGSNPVRKRALGACRRDTCFLSLRHQGHTSWEVCVLDGQTGRMEHGELNFAQHTSFHDDDP